MQHYFDAVQYCEELKRLKFECEDSMVARGELCKCVVVTVTFAAMAIEAFLNHYAASQWGDKFFYRNFDNLSPLSKLQMISKFIFHNDIDKSGQLYTLMKELIKKRNFYIHSKSTEAAGFGMTHDEMEEYEEFLDSDEGAEQLVRDYQIDIGECEQDLQVAYNALQSIREVGKYFDVHDKSILATAQFFWLGYFSGMTGRKKYILEVQKKLGLK